MQYVVAPGTLTLPSAGRRTASTTGPPAAATSWASVSPGDISFTVAFEVAVTLSDITPISPRVLIVVRLLPARHVLDAGFDSPGENK